LHNPSKKGIFHALAAQFGNICCIGLGALAGQSVRVSELGVPETECAGLFVHLIYEERLPCLLAFLEVKQRATPCCQLACGIVATRKHHSV
jgi:hypothetical protein